MSGISDRTTGEGGDEASRSSGEGRSAGAVYRELLPIGKGGSAKITVAIAEGMAGVKKLVVLKTIREELITDSAAKQMFLNEARVSARMNHPNVVQVYEVFLRQETPVIVMEFLDGQPLSAVIARAYQRKALTLELAVAILSKVLAGLHYAHTLSDFTGEPLGLIHRDVSPHNVMLTYDGQIKLVDFGIAKLAGAEQQTREGIIKGKLMYMAPEHFAGKVSARSDIFGVGVMLWELATRQRFWADLPEPTVIGRLISGDLPHLAGHANVDAELYQICCRALAYRAEDRYPSAEAMQEDLERYLAQRGIVISPAAIGRLVTESCSEARQNVQTNLREQLHKQGLSFGGFDLHSQQRVRSGSEAAEASSQRPREKSEPRAGGVRSQQPQRAAEHTSSGRPRPSAGKDANATGALSQQTVTRVSGGAGTSTLDERLPVTVAYSKAALDQTTGGLRAQPSGTPSSDRAHHSSGRLRGAPSSARREDEVPLRLFGGASPTARVGVALAGFGTLGVLILALGLATPQGGVTLPSNNAASASGANQRPSPELPRSVRIRASAQPSSAAWYLDDTKLDSNPVELSVASDAAVHTLRAEAPGYQPFVKSIRYDADVDVTIELKAQ